MFFPFTNYREVSFSVGGSGQGDTDFFTASKDCFVLPQLNSFVGGTSGDNDFFPKIFIKNQIHQDSTVRSPLMAYQARVNDGSGSVENTIFTHALFLKAGQILRFEKRETSQKITGVLRIHEYA